MVIEYDEAKNVRNIAQRQLPFEWVENLNWATAQQSEDTRHEYPERRIVILAYLSERLHVACVTPVAGGFRVISFRKANKREVRRYEEFNQTHD